MKPARDAMREVCKARMTSFGQAGNAGKIKPVTCKEFAKVYG
jgi:fructose-bisphosphate aldolase, class II